MGKVLHLRDKSLCLPPLQQLHYYYQIIRGIVEVVSIIKENINKEFIRIKKKRERNLFTLNGIKI